MGKKRKSQLVQDGVQLSVKGIGKFVRDLDRATDAINRFANATQRANDAGLGSAAFDARVVKIVEWTLRSE